MSLISAEGWSEVSRPCYSLRDVDINVRDIFDEDPFYFKCCDEDIYRVRHLS